MRQEDLNDKLSPSDSVSQQGSSSSKTSRVSSYLAIASAKKAGLTEKSRLLKQHQSMKMKLQQEIEEAERQAKVSDLALKEKARQLQFESERMTLEEELRAADAEEQTLVKHLDRDRAPDPVLSPVIQDQVRVPERQFMLNPLVPEFHQRQYSSTPQRPRASPDRRTAPDVKTVPAPYEPDWLISFEPTAQRCDPATLVRAAAPTTMSQPSPDVARMPQPVPADMTYRTGSAASMSQQVAEMVYRPMPVMMSHPADDVQAAMPRQAVPGTMSQQVTGMVYQPSPVMMPEMMSHPADVQAAMPRQAVPVVMSQPAKVATHQNVTTTSGNVSAHPNYVIPAIDTSSSQVPVAAPLDIQRQLIDALRLPKTGLQKFDGEPMQYWAFMNSFDSLVHRACVTDGDKLNCLMEYCCGKAARVIRPCALMSPSAGYARARELLKERFGDEYTIAKAWVKKIVEGPPVKTNSGEALQEFTDDVRGCYETLKAMNKLAEVNSQDRMADISTRLPLYIQSRWRKEAHRSKLRTKSYPDFKAFVTFLEMVSGEENDPVFGKIQAKDRVEKKRTFPQKKTGVSLTVQATGKDNQATKAARSSPAKIKSVTSDAKPETKKMNCHICSQSHKVAACPKFKAMEPTIRLEVVKEKRLCFNCLNFSNHSYRQCHRSSDCHEKDFYVRGKGQHEFIKTDALLDSGSNRTFCSKSLLSQLKLEGSRTALSLETLGQSAATDAIEECLQVTPTSRKAKKRSVLDLPRVYAIDSFPNSITGPSQLDIGRWRHLTGVCDNSVDGKGVSLLIGQDVPQAILPLEVRRGRDDEPYAIRTSLGWTLNGPIGGQPADSTAVCSFIQSLASGQPQMSQNDKKVVGMWDKSVSLVDGHYQLNIPFKKTPPELPDNRMMAEKRLQSLGRRLSRDPALHDKYRSGMQDLLDKGFAEPVPEDEMSQPGSVWYLPHHNVVNPSKPEKFRIVFDCAATYAGTSLNDQVFQGPDLMNKLIGVLMRFRECPVAVMGYIQEMFHMVKVKPEFRDALRFLFWKDGDPKKKPQVYRMTVHLFGGVWSPSCCSYALRRTAEDHKDEFHPDTIETVLQDFYADDCLKSVPGVDVAVKLVEELRTLLQLGGFRLTKWSSNSKEVLLSIPVEDRAKTIKDLDLTSDSLPIERALGVQWDTETDTFGLKIHYKEPFFTRRGLLRITSSMYDPLGLVCPFVLEAKMIFLTECRSDKGWDDEMSPASIKRWQRWLDGLPKLEEFQVPRCIHPTDFGDITEARLHHFSDGSADAYGAVSYPRLVNSDGAVHCTILMAKSRLAPMTPMTIPRLELSAAVLAVKMDNLIRREIRLPLQESTFWTDSTIVLQYVKNKTKRFQTFVANPVAVIHDGTRPSQWRYVGIKDNPADDASRGLNAEQMLSDTRWRQGPAFLWLSEDSWPEMPEGQPNLLERDPEVKKEAKSCAVVTVPVDFIVKLFNRYSSWPRLLKAVAYLLRFLKWLHKKRPKMNDRLSPEELKAAERAILRCLQKRHYSNEINALRSNARITKQSSIFELEPYLDEDQLLRVTGRLKNASIPDPAKHPVIVPRDDHVTTLIVRDAHERLCRHSGREHVMANLRQNYWIPQARQLVKRVLRDCIVCKVLHGKLGQQKMADLPPERVTPSKYPYQCLGVDVFGPFYVKRGRSQEKRYGCMFTCLSMRAIHLEKLSSMDTDSFINALIRFCARRGVPKLIRSDNGTNFVGANRVLRESIAQWNESHRLKEYLLQNHIDWTFNTPTASNMGGVWERNIRTARKVMNSILQKQSLDDERLDTIFAEVENVVNSRPLTVVSNDPKDQLPLTPNDLLRPFGKGFPSPIGTFGKADMFGKRWRHVQFVVDQFWKRWTAEYLSALQVRSKWIAEQPNIRVNDLVLVLDQSLARSHWPLARVTDTFPEKDGLVRSVELKTAFTDKMVRPINKIVLLEATADDHNQD
ncbi:uncharacterized protein LOC135484816 [Lineus longissimus]|uniref:uncharacterized protein LOC135484816 n=1 Tax=Lineus longissimus TaxID=88925 RepID=UPI00315CBCF5